MTDKERKKSSGMFFSSFIKTNKWRYLSGIILLIGVNILQLMLPRITGNAVNSMVYSGGNQNMLTYSGIIIAIALLAFVLQYLSRIQLIGASNLFDFILRNKMFMHLTLLPQRFFDKNGVGDLMALLVNDVRAVRMALGRGIIITINTIVLSTASVIIMSKTMSLKMALFLLAPFPLLILIILKTGVVINKRFKKVQESFAALTRKVQENISGIRIIKAFVQEEAEISNFSKLNNENYRINMNLVKVQSAFSPFIQLILNLSYLAVLYYGGLMTIEGTITIGDFVAFNSYIAIILRPVRNIGALVSIIQRARASYSRISELLSEKTIDEQECLHNNQNKGDQQNITTGLKGKIEFRNLSYRYNNGGQEVLKNINLTIEPGKTLGIVGRIGSGKTTLVNLLLKLYEVEERGKLFIDGKDIKDIPHKVVRDSIGYVPQDNVLFSRKIKDNIAFSPKKSSIKEIEKAAKISKIYDDIMDTHDKFDTILGERGINISGGQKQRISIARALIKDPSILILDDCLSAVDTNTEKEIMKNLKSIMKGRTCIIIAHRISAVMDADEIIVLEKGKIAERGTHEELIDKMGIYYKMYLRQLLEEKVINL
ncbi:MAG TPA: ABC transporter ATP-binding protein [Clostridiaceae bacterium]|nr:ABC transporter ATP-binding protein [Clostridiaceae bacterium]